MTEEVTYSLFQENDIFLGQRPKVWLKIRGESISIHLITRFRVTEVLVWGRSGNEIMEVVVREDGDVVDLFFLVIRHVLGYLTNMIDGRIIEL